MLNRFCKNRFIISNIMYAFDANVTYKNNNLNSIPIFVCNTMKGIPQRLIKNKINIKIIILGTNHCQCHFTYTSHICQKVTVKY